VATKSPAGAEGGNEEEGQEDQAEAATVPLRGRDARRESTWLTKTKIRSRRSRTHSRPLVRSSWRIHEGEFVVFKDQRPVGFYSSFKEAYSGAIDLFGLESVFLVSEVRRQVPGSALLSWDLAVL